MNKMALTKFVVMLLVGVNAALWWFYAGVHFIAISCVWWTSLSIGSCGRIDG